MDVTQDLTGTKNEAPDDQNNNTEAGVVENILRREPIYRLNRLKSVSERLWFAGVGAISLSEKQARQFFDKAIVEGKEKSTASKNTSVPRRIYNSLGRTVDESTNYTLHQIAAPSRRDIDELTGKVDGLTSSVAVLMQQLEVSTKKDVQSKKRGVA